MTGYDAQQPDQPDGRAGHAPCLRKARARPARGLSCALNGQPDGIVFKTQQRCQTSPSRVAPFRWGLRSCPYRISTLCQHSRAALVRGRPAVLRSPGPRCNAEGVARLTIGLVCRIAMPLLAPAQPPCAVHSQRRFTWWVGCHESGVHFPTSLNVARSPLVTVAASEGNVSAKPFNKPINPTPFAASRRLLAQAARRGSCAGYRHR